ncbi:MAG: hypothetical protein Q4C98_10470 [Capnocytophaga sp.]|nr:hypothetical protein [Capnocytophaga sp.]
MNPHLFYEFGKDSTIKYRFDIVMKNFKEIFSIQPIDFFYLNVRFPNATNNTNIYPIRKQILSQNEFSLTFETEYTELKISAFRLRRPNTIPYFSYSASHNNVVVANSINGSADGDYANQMLYFRDYSTTAEALSTNNIIIQAQNF